MKLAKDTLAVAQQDIKASIVLFEHSFFPQAVFSLQQGIEKGWKAYGYYIGTITPEKARSMRNDGVGHKGHKVLKITLNEFRRIIISPLIRQVNAIRKYYPSSINKESPEGSTFLTHFDNDLHWAQKEIDKITESYPNPTSEELQTRIERYQNDEQKIQECEDYFKSPEFDPKTRESIRSRAIEEVMSVLKNNPKAKEIIDNKTNNIFDDERIKNILLAVTKDMVIINPLLYFAIVTQLHESKTRYPDKDYSPLKEYTKDHPIILYFESIADITQTCLNKMDELFQISL